MARILIIDNEPDTLDIYSSALTLLGHSPVTCESGIEALEVIAAEPLDLILLDYMMPVMDGFETLRRIRQLPSGASIPVLMVTASADSSLEDQIRLDGGSGCVEKPLNLDELEALIVDLVPSGGLAPMRTELAA